jgi:hypothetical protein
MPAPFRFFHFVIILLTSIFEHLHSTSVSLDLPASLVPPAFVLPINRHGHLSGTSPQAGQPVGAHRAEVKTWNTDRLLEGIQQKEPELLEGDKHPMEKTAKTEPERYPPALLRGSIVYRSKKGTS